MQELQNSRKIAKVKVVKKQKLWGVVFDEKLQKSKDYGQKFIQS